MGVAAARVVGRGGRGSVVGRWLVAVALLVGCVALAIGLLAALAWAGTLALPNRPVLGASILVGAFVVPVIRGLATSGRPDAVVDEWSVEPGRHQGVWDVVADVAGDLGTRPPTRLYLVPTASATVRQQAALLGLRPGERELTLGMGLFSVCTVAELRAVVAHELAHFVGGDARVDAVTARTWAKLMAIVDHLDDAVASWPFVLYARAVGHVMAPILWREELRADAVAASVVGASTVSAALEQVDRGSVALDELVGRFRLLARNGRYPRNLYEGLRQVLRDPSWVAGIDERARERRLAGASPTHPDLGTRLAHLRGVGEAGVRVGPAAPCPGDGIAAGPARDHAAHEGADRDALLPASSLLDPDGRDEERASARLGVQSVPGPAAPAPVGWSEATATLWLVGRGRRDGNPPMLGDGSPLGEALALLDRLEVQGVRAVATSLGHDLARWPRPQRRTVAASIVQVDLTRLVARAIMAHGWRPAFGWGLVEDVFVGPDGTRAAVPDWTRSAVESPAIGIPSLRARLAGIEDPDTSGTTGGEGEDAGLPRDPGASPGTGAVGDGVA